MDGVLQLLHVQLVRRDVEHGRHRIGQLHRKRLRLGRQLDRRIEASGVAGEVVLVPAIESHPDDGLVVRLNLDADVQVRRVAVTDSSHLVKQKIPIA